MFRCPILRARWLALPGRRGDHASGAQSVLQQRNSTRFVTTLLKTPPCSAALFSSWLQASPLLALGLNHGQLGATARNRRRVPPWPRPRRRRRGRRKRPGSAGIQTARQLCSFAETTPLIRPPAGTKRSPYLHRKSLTLFVVAGKLRIPNRCQTTTAGTHRRRGQLFSRTAPTATRPSARTQSSAASAAAGLSSSPCSLPPMPTLVLRQERRPRLRHRRRLRAHRRSPRLACRYLPSPERLRARRSQRDSPGSLQAGM